MSSQKTAKTTARFFLNTKRGKVVLGYGFDSINQAWRLPEEKVLATRIILHDVVQRTDVGLDEMQSLLNRLNFVGMMCPFLKESRYNINRELTRRSRTPRYVQFYLRRRRLAY